MVKSTVVLAVVLMTFGAAGVFGEDWGESPHPLAAQCRNDYSQECEAVCLICHTLPRDYSLAVEIGEEAALCITCHPKRQREGGGSYLFPRSGGEHPSGIVYERDDPSLKEEPENGAKIYCGEGRDGVETCNVLCSSCHDAMSDEADLLRVANVGSALCLSCHRK